MAVPLSKLQETIVATAKAVTNAAEVCFAAGLRFGRVEQGIAFQIDVFDDTADFVELEQSVQSTPPIVKTSEQTDLPATVKQSQSFGRSTETDVSYQG